MKKKIQIKELELKIKKTEILLVHRLSILALTIGTVLIVIIVVAIIIGRG